MDTGAKTRAQHRADLVTATELRGYADTNTTRLARDARPRPPLNRAEIEHLLAQDSVAQREHALRRL